MVAAVAKAVAAKAAVGQGVPVGDLVFTVVDPERVAFRVKVDEKDLHLLSPGLKGRVELAGFPDAEGAIALESVSPVPRDGKVDARFTVSARQCPSYSAKAEDAQGVPISAIIVPERNVRLRIVTKPKPPVKSGCFRREASTPRVNVTAKTTNTPTMKPS